MVFFKRVEIRNLSSKYVKEVDAADEQRGIFALEPIKAGERVWFCECSEHDLTCTRAQLLDIIEREPQLEYFVRAFSYMIDDDLYALPNTYREQRNNDECALFNHSCKPNVGLSEAYSNGYGDSVVAFRDIDVGEELTYHYGLLETEASLIYGLECCCDVQPPESCCKRMTFDFYRDATFVREFYQFMSPYLKRKVNDMRERWYTSKCYVKRFPIAANNDASLLSSLSSSSSSQDLDSSFEAANKHCEKGLVCLRSIKKDELVARFNADSGTVEMQMDERNHYIRRSNGSPNCYLVDHSVFARCDIEPGIELTI